MNNWTLSRRIITGFVVLMVFILTVGGYALTRMSSMSASLANVADNTLPSIILLNGLTANTKGLIIEESRLAAAAEDDRADVEAAARAYSAAIDKGIVDYDKLISDPEDARLFEEVKVALKAQTVAMEKEHELAKRGASAEDLYRFNKETLYPAIDRALKAIEADVAYNEKLGAASAEAGKASASLGFLVVSIILALSVVFSVGFAVLIIRSVNRALSEVTDDLDRGALQTSSAASQVSMASQQLSSGAAEQASAVQETSASLEEMSSMVRSTADNAQKAKLLAAEARAVAQAGSQTMTAMLSAMQEIDTSSSDIAKIVKNIDEIAFQTNILALNAAVEAARAGEAGAGFAVVADEVRSLAQRSAAAAKETADKIDAAIASSRRGSTSSSEVERALIQITDKVAATDILVAEIAKAASEQAQGISQVSVAVSQMDKVSQANSSSAEDSASAAEELNAQSEVLRESVLKLRALVGGHAAAQAAAAAGSRYGAPVSPVAWPGNAGARQAMQRPVPALGMARSNRSLGSIPMPEPSSDGSIDGSFRKFS
jgi:methyl-accepting chemotaxis protein